jgi:hypothetical protein
LEQIGVIVVEIHPIPGEDPNALVKLLTDSGLSIVRHDRDGQDLQLVYAVRLAKT